jgi:DnaJ-class molecular chaperone
VVIHVQEHPFFHRDGNDLYCEGPAQLPHSRPWRRDPDSDARGRRAVQGARGHRQRSVVPASRPRDAGRHGTRAAATCSSPVKVSTPKKLTRDQKKLLEQLATSLPKEKFEPTPVNHEDKGLFDRVKDIFG